MSLNLASGITWVTYLLVRVSDEDEAKCRFRGRISLID